MIGKKLKELLQSTNTKQVQLAKFIGISPSRLSNYLADKREPDLVMLSKMAHYLNVDLNYFAHGAVATPSPVVVSEPVALREVVGLVRNLPFMRSNQREAKETLAVSALFTDGYAVEDLLVLEAQQDIGENVHKGDYIIVEKYTEDKGRMGDTIVAGNSCYKLAISDDQRFLIAEKTSKIIRFDSSKTYYILRWMFLKKQQG
jgi:transcriptional regulator with XRE-family HTH domain